MPDPLSILGGLTAAGSILKAVTQAIATISIFCDNFRQAPIHFVRIKDQLITIREILAEVENQVTDLTDDELLPPNIRKRLNTAVTSILTKTDDIQKSLPQSASERSSVRERLQWAVFKKKLSKAHLEELEKTEASLLEIIQILTLRTVLTLLVESRQRQHSIQPSFNDQLAPDRAPTRQRPDPSCSNKQPAHGYEPAKQHPVLLSTTKQTVPDCRLSIRQINSLVLNRDSILRRLGFWGSFCHTTDSRQNWRSKVEVGFQPPVWIMMRSILLQLSVSDPLNGLTGVSITSGYLCVQNRVSDDSPFFRACYSGDLALMKQCLGEQPWAIRNRSTTTGETPLLLAIKGQDLEAVRWLLEQGANPNDTWEFWFECLRLLVLHGASVHEVVYGKTLGMLKLTRGLNTTFDYTLDFIHLLQSENYIDFDIVDKCGSSNLEVALRSPKHALEAVQTIAGLGVDLSRIINDGRSYLSIACELVRDVRVLEYLFANGCAIHINRQDQWGWTPLHYCIFAECASSRHSPCLPKIGLLFEKGADPDIKARHHDLIPIPSFELQEFTPIELASFCERYNPNGITQMLLELVNRRAEDNGDVFYDAVAIQEIEIE
ncbi:ankyrin repeat-containing domain protein [Xylariaceae sp. FL0255]|nr:ankyrin repeat-containing domain protein [Xylariaceae sp. FL0255]